MDKFRLMVAFLTGQPLTVYPNITTMVPVDFVVINKIEREDGSNRSYNLTGILRDGRECTIHIITIT